MTLFAPYYDQTWLPLGPYFQHHRKRFLQTWDSLKLGFDAQPSPAPRGRVLDMGGVGPIAAYLASQGWQASETKVDLRGPLPLADDQFDLVLCLETIEHIKDVDSDRIEDLEAFNYSGVQNMLREMRRVTKPSGKVVVSTPNACSLLTLSKWLHGQVLLMDPAHVREFTPAELQRVCKACGLQVFDMQVVDSWTLEVAATERALLNLIRGSSALAPVPHGDNIIAHLMKGVALPD